MYRAGLYTNNRYVWNPIIAIPNWASADDTIIGEQLASLSRSRSLWYFVCLYFWFQSRSLLVLADLMHSAGLFWASEGAVALGYPEASKRGKYMK
jgi:hypothetical protein